jgi:acyl carrier protein
LKRDEVLPWLATVFGEPVESLKFDSQRDQIHGWDSMGMLMLMADVDEKFGIQMSEQDVKGLKSVTDIVALLERAGQVS